MSEVAEHFRATIQAQLDDEQAELLSAASGTGVARELRRGLHLTDRAVRQWAARAGAHPRPDHRSAYALLAPLRPELGQAVQRAAVEEQQTGVDAERELISQMVWGIGERLAAIDTEAPPASLQHALNQMAVEAGEIVRAARRVLAGAAWVRDEANEALRELVGVG